MSHTRDHAPRRAHRHDVQRAAASRAAATTVDNINVDRARALRKVRGGLIDLAHEPHATPLGGLRAQLIALGFIVPGSPDADGEPPEGCT